MLVSLFIYCYFENIIVNDIFSYSYLYIYLHVNFQYILSIIKNKGIVILCKRNKFFNKKNNRVIYG